MIEFDPANLYLYIIVALLPLSAAMVVFQTNPYHALVIRGLLGAMAVLVYTVLGAPDVALTEALVGTLLAITLYAITVRSSLVMRLGLLKADPNPRLDQLLADLRTVVGQHYMRLERVVFANSEDLQQALLAKEIHATCRPTEASSAPSYQTSVRVQRLYDLLQAELPAAATQLTYVDADVNAGAARPSSPPQDKP
ncbi:MAG: DUF4040 domain-containing protein [Elainella sp.]